jgi:hypothetical protein
VRLLELLFRIHRVELRDYPTHYPRKKRVAYLPAIAQVNLFETLCAVGHIQYRRAGNVPDTLHSPHFGICSAGLSKGAKPFIANMEAV